MAGWMLGTSSRHSIAVRDCRAGAMKGQWQDSLNVNIAELITLLNGLPQEAVQEHESGFALSTKNGKKRLGDPTALVEPPQKRMKTIVDNVDDHGQVESHEVPVWLHTFEAQCTTYDESNQKSVGDTMRAKLLQWKDEEQKLIHALSERSKGSKEPVEFELGVVSLRLSHGQIFVFKPPLMKSSNVEVFDGNEGVLNRVTPLLKLPNPFDQPLDEDEDKHSPVMKDPLHAASVMQQHGRATFLATLHIIWLPPFAVDQNNFELPFRLRIDVKIALVLPKIFEPFVRLKQRDVITEDAQICLVSHVLPPATRLSNYDGQTDIPFFFSILGPAPALPSLVAEDVTQPEGLRPTLLPFQRRSVGWLLEREGKMVNSAGDVVPLVPVDSDLPLFWEKITLSTGDQCYFNRLDGSMMPNKPPRDEFQGGILAEEPGLGKTLESIALILLNPATNRHPGTTRWDPEARVQVKEIKTTLIVTPAALATQWADELASHAPGLRVMVYSGWSKNCFGPDTQDQMRKRKRKRGKETATKSGRRRISGSNSTKGKRKALSQSDEEESEDEILDEVFDWCTYVNQFDVCIVTYNILQQDLGVARAPVIRPRREAASYSKVERPRSPLVQCEWYRVIMDEVQMVGGGKTEEMVSLIPRLSSFAVSGTPARASVSDLVHVIKFLRVQSAISSSRTWSRLLQPAFASQFKELFERIAIRTTKLKVKNELTIPEQRRFVVPIELGRVERHVYDQNLEEALLDLGLDARGVAASDGWQVDFSVLRTWLRKLRGICTHPQVGQLQKQNDKLIKSGALKTIGEVLENMKDQNWRKLMDDRKARIHALVRRAQLVQNDEANGQRYRKALEILMLAQKDTQILCEDIQKVIDDHDANGELLKQVTANRKRGSSNDPSATTDNSNDIHGKGKQRAESVNDDNDVDDGLPKTPAGEEQSNKRRALQSRLRESMVVHHQVHFLLGDVYHTLGESYSSLEDDAYSAAENIRKNLLKTTEDAANRSMIQLKRTAAKEATTERQLQISHCGKGGIKSDHLLREADDIIDVLNSQADLLWQWRARISTLLTEKLSTGDEEQVDGQEYARTLETQGEAEIYLQAYAALMADRREVMIAERTALAAHDAREKKLRQTRAANKAVAAEDEPESLENAELQPEHEVLQGELATHRKEILRNYYGRAIKSIMVDLSSIATHVASDKDPEKAIAKDWAKHFRSLISDQGRILDKLEADMSQFRKAFNDRIQYFRQLQELSDSVTVPEWEGKLEDAIQASKDEENQLDAEINKDRARQRYLEHMAKSQEDGDDDDDEGTCILCRCEFIRGFITQCAHVFCEGCLKAWLSRKEGKACPVCRVIINMDQMQRITMQDKDPEVTNLLTHPSSSEPAPKSRRVICYNAIDSDLLDKIQNVESHGSYGSKIQTLVRHLLYLQDSDPGAKSIVFSAWADSLHIIEHALIVNGICCLRIDQTRGKQNAAKIFKTDPNILVLLLHGERENAGLNVTCASRVFLVESVVQHAFEIQAIARIDRMGQTRPTEVYCYYAEDTVEKTILDLAVKQGLSLYTKDHASDTLNVTSFAMGSEKAHIDAPAKRAKQKGDFIFKADDMLAILFPHMFEDLEFLLPGSSKDTDMGGDVDDEGPSDIRVQRFTGNEEAVAGPSRFPY